MTDHDDQISSNRRRLFKALSAAPVVMTLRPGSAAASSAYQCVVNIRDNLVLDPGPIVPDAANPFLYQALWYWELTLGSRVLKANAAPASGNYVHLDGTGIDETALSSGLIVVSMDPSIPNNGDFYLLPNDPQVPASTLASGFSGDPDVGVSVVSGSTLEITNDKGDVCLRQVGLQAGFAVVVATANNDMLVIPQGTYPQVPVVVEDASAGQNQGITGTCLCSVDPDNPLCVSNG